jgi:3-deoxy-D-manno-octulosonate 8-phosphate phosphatase (KDO 8-P phosphatase)
MDCSSLPCTQGRGVGGEGCICSRVQPPHPRPLSPEYGGEGRNATKANDMTLSATNLTLPERCAHIAMLVLDVDGVLTDGRVVYTDQGAEIKAFHVRDGSGLKLWTRLGRQAGIITGRSSLIVERRAQELGIQAVIQGVDDKKAALVRMIAEVGVTLDQVGVIGDDLPDLPMLRACGLAAAVADACAEAKEDADYVTQAAGGRGAVREVIELILRAQGEWQSIVARYRNE